MGFDSCDANSVGAENAKPGLIDNSALLKGSVHKVAMNLFILSALKIGLVANLTAKAATSCRGPM